MRALTVFREPLRKRQLMELAEKDVKQMIEAGQAGPVETQIFFKRLKIYVDSFISSNEKQAIEEYEKDKGREYQGADVSFTQGAAILDYEQDIIYADLKGQLDARKKMLDMAYKMKDAFFDSEGVQVPKVKVKGYRKDSFNVRL